MKCEACQAMHQDIILRTIPFPYHTTRKHRCKKCRYEWESIAVNVGSGLVDALWLLRRVEAERDLFQLQTANLEGEIKRLKRQLGITE